MVLKNLNRYIRALVMGKVNGNFINITNPLVDINGAEVKQLLNNANYPFRSGLNRLTTSAALVEPISSNTQCVNCAVISVGTGTTPVTEDDTRLESPITNLTASSFVVDISEVDGKTKATYTRIFTYTGAEDITVTEVGLYVGCYGTSTSYYYDICLARELFTTPIPIQNGDTFTVSLAIEI
jgi:hypothetical protein